MFSLYVWYMCSCMSTHVPEDRNTCVCICVEARNKNSMSFLSLFYFFFLIQCVSLTRKIINSPRQLASQLRGCLWLALTTPCPQCWVITPRNVITSRHMLSHPGFLHECWGSELRPSCLSVSVTLLNELPSKLCICWSWCKPVILS